jgi:hypothetical protein
MAGLFDQRRPRGLFDLGGDPETGSVTDPALDPFAPRQIMPQIDYGNAGAGRGGGGRLPPQLPMDKASRMARAKEMGFRTNMPLYHGTDRSFIGFDPGKGGTTTGVAPARVGVWTALEPDVADDFAKVAAGVSRGNEQIYPLVHRAQKPATIRLDGDETNFEITIALQDAFAQGHDAVLLRNHTSPSGKTPRNILVVRDPSQLRSPAAAFDPAKKDSSDLLANIAGLTAGGAAAAAALLSGSTDQASAAMPQYRTGGRF